MCSPSMTFSSPLINAGHISKTKGKMQDYKSGKLMVGLGPLCTTEEHLDKRDIFNFFVNFLSTHSRAWKTLRHVDHLHLPLPTLLASLEILYQCGSLQRENGQGSLCDLIQLR